MTIATSHRLPLKMFGLPHDKLKNSLLLGNASATSTASSHYSTGSSITLK
jgi:hypothetical protein